MSVTRRYGITPQLDIEQILLEAQNRWLRPAEICEILRNYRKFRIAPEPPNRPPSGSLFLFDRKVLRYFRKDGHNWRKKKDNKTVKEAHERLKVGSVDVLHCYYAHGEENENFQRRSYWLLEEDFMHIVLVHYREVQGNKSSFGRNRDNDELSPSCPMETPASSNSFSNHNQMPLQATDAESLSSAQTSEYEDAESDNYQASSRYHPHIEFQQSEDGPMIDATHLSPYFPVSSSNGQGYYPGSTSGSNHFSVAQEDITKVFNEAGVSLTFNGPRTQADLTSWDDILEHCATSIPSMPFPASVSSVHPSSAEVDTDCGSSMLGEIIGDAYGLRQGVITSQVENAQIVNAEDTNALKLNMEVKNASLKEGNAKYSYLLKQLSLDIPNSEEDGGLKKYDSFSRWMSKELEEVDDSHIQSTSAHYWNTVESECVVADSVMSHNEDVYLLSPSLSQDQFFSIVDFSPTWSYAGLETKVIVTGTFLKDKIDVDKCKWSCMFGEVEVPAEVLAYGILRCRAPPHKSGRVPFYITCSNRLACSEIREFEYRVSHPQYVEMTDWGSTNELLFHIRLEKLLSIDLDDYQKPISSLVGEKLILSNKVSSLLREDDDWSPMLSLTSSKEFSSDNARDQLLEKLLKQKLHAWLLCRIAEDGKGPSILDKEGQGVLHLAAALGYDWGIAPTIAAGVSIDFRDVHGWTALHWAASCGRERTVVALFSLGAAPGALTDPTPEFPGGRTPADLASTNGHKGIAGFLAESSLTKHLSMLTVKEVTSDVTAISSVEAVENAATTAIRNNDSNMQAGLIAVRNAAQAAARIHQVFRIHSFHRKKLAEYEDDKFGMSDEQALSFISVKSNKAGLYDEPVAAAIRIQNKFRGWKGRKDFLIMRQRIVKIQAHVRGHLVRKHYKKIVWTVGIVEKAILRWRRKGSGLRGFRSERLIEAPVVHQENKTEDDYDFLKEGRKQTEARLEKALARVKSMVQYPEARDQYRRLLTNVDEFQESKVVLERVLNDTEVGEGDMMCDIDELLGEDSLVPFN